MGRGALVELSWVWTLLREGVDQSKRSTNERTASRAAGEGGSPVFWVEWYERVGVNKKGRDEEMYGGEEVMGTAGRI